MNKINVQLYGGKSIFGGRKESPLEADVLYCDSADKCSLYREGKCLNCRHFGWDRCEKGDVSTIKGYTSKARKYYDFRNTYESDECYNRLTYANNYVGLLDHTLYLNLKYVRVAKPHTEEDRYCANKWGYLIEDGYIGKTTLFIPLDEMKVDFLAQILSYKPRALMGGLIEDYQKKVVPSVVDELKKVVPTLYKQLVNKYPDFDKKPEYVGRYAFMKTLVDGSVVVDCHGNKAIKKGDNLYCKDFTKGFVPFNGIQAECVIRIGDKQTYQITSNDQCDENTVFA